MASTWTTLRSPASIPTENAPSLAHPGPPSGHMGPKTSGGTGVSSVQLSVVDGNVAGRRLYEGLGFEPFAKLRTILFT